MLIHDGIYSDRVGLVNPEKIRKLNVVVLRSLETELEQASSASPHFFLKEDDSSTFNLLINKRHILR
jgi:hypothetical protein